MSTPNSESLAIQQAILEGASGDDIAALPLPESYRAAFVKRDDVGMFEGLASEDKDPRESLHIGEVAMPELAPRRGVHRRHGLIDQLQHGVDIHF